MPLVSAGSETGVCRGLSCLSSSPRGSTVVLGGAAYIFHWLKRAVKFARKHRAALASRPVWLFSSGPLGTDLVDKDGKDVLQTTRPKEWDELTELLRPRGERVFFGAYDPDATPIGMGERIVRHMPAARDAVPAGDFRDWAAIDTWAHEIAESTSSDHPQPEWQPGPHNSRWGLLYGQVTWWSRGQTGGAAFRRQLGAASRSGATRALGPTRGAVQDR